jgi:hypothetical protein
MRRFPAPWKMKPKWVLVAITGLALMSGTASLTAPREIEELCFEQLQHATLLLLSRGAGKHSWPTA